MLLCDFLARVSVLFVPCGGVSGGVGPPVAKLNTALCNAKMRRELGRRKLRCFGFIYYQVSNNATALSLCLVLSSSRRSEE